MLAARATQTIQRYGFKGSATDIAAAAAIISILAILVVRIPSPLLDGLLAINLSASLVLLLVAFYINHPLDFSTFPSILLLSTIFRLALNISSTKLILGGSEAGDVNLKAGTVIEFFGSVVAGNDAVVGFVIFVILIVIQFIVITKGSGRVAEVAARFTLDAMPGKQMAIDADLNAGLITEDEARSRRKKITEEADFYGAMDGASKFVRGDAIAGIIITIINLVGGFVVGRMREGMDLSELFRTYTILTIGDGLVSQIPALLIATAAGIVVTRAGSEKSLGENVSSQLFAKPDALYVSSAALGSIALLALMTPSRGLAVPFLLISAGVGMGARRLQQAAGVREQKEAEEKKRKDIRPQEPESVEKLLPVDPMEIEIGYGLVPLVDTEQGGDLLERVTAIRRSIALEMGMVVPPIRIRDNMQLNPHVYAIKIRGVQVARGEIRPDRLLAMTPSLEAEKIPGMDTVEPAFGLPAKWIRKTDRSRAEGAGYNVIEPVAVLATHLTEVVRSHAADILGRQEVKSLVDTLKESQPVIVDELIPNALTIGKIQKVLQNLLRERIPIRNIGMIFEALADHAAESKDPEVLTEFARAALARVITQRHSDASGIIHVLTLEPNLENTLVGAIRSADRSTYLAIEPGDATRFLRGIGAAYEKALAATADPVILTTPELRYHLRRLTERTFPRIPILSYHELAPEAEIKNVGLVRMANAN